MDQRNRPEQTGPEPQHGDARVMDHLYQLMFTDEDTLYRLEDDDDLETGTDPEFARRLAAVRTELLQRQFAQQRGG